MLVSMDRVSQFLQREDRVVVARVTGDVDNPDAVVVRNCTVQYCVEEDAEKSKAADGKPSPAPEKGGAALQTIRPKCRRETLFPDLNLVIPRGQLTLMVGPTGSGKSVIMNTMIGETLVTPGSEIVCNGRVSYITQEAWII